jgi:hypothetical protein
LVFLWDIFSAHRCPEARALIAALNINLEFIPPGMTAELQPLAGGIFVNLKARAHQRFNAVCKTDQEPTMADSLGILLGAWGSISQEEVFDACDNYTA